VFASAASPRYLARGLLVVVPAPAPASNKAANM